MNFYLAALDDRDREAGDNPNIGLILCREHNRVVVEYALRGVDATIGIARYQLLAPDTLPKDLAGALPSQDELAPGLLTAEGTNDE